MADKKAKKLIVDSNAFIKGVRLEAIGNELWTVPQVLGEVRDKRARELLAAVPFEIKTRDPSPAALRAVVDFARKTGDFAFLSAVDLRVLALTYTFESEAKGTTAHLRTRPLKVGTPAVAPAGANENDKNDDNNDDEDGDENNTENKTENNENNENNENSNNNNEGDHEDEEDAEEDAEETESAPTVPSAETTTPGNEDAGAAAPPQRGDEDDDDGWITPANIGKVRAKRGTTGDEQEEQVEVGCFTTDYAMQSVLLQMGLKLLSVDGMVIKRIRQYVLKCHACFKVCKNLEKKFCPSCGNTTLLRFSVTTDDLGNLQYTQAQRLTNRGSIFPIPMPKGGKHNKDLILVEDQYMQKTQYLKDARVEDVFNAEYSFAYNKAGPKQNVVVGHGRKNPNAAKRRIGKKNKPISALQ